MDAFQNWLNVTPIWLIGASLLAVMLLAAGVGTMLRLRRRRRQASADEGSNEDGYVVSAVLGLLALLMGFTFSLAVDRYDARRLMVLNESNAIGTAYLRAQLLPEPDRARTTAILLRYTENRVRMGHARAKDIPPMMAVNDALITELWAATSAAFDRIKALDFSTSYVESINAMIDLGTARKAARMARVPAGVFLVLLIYLIVTAAVLGHVLDGRGGRRAAVFLMALLTLSMMLIIDIDRPTGGSIDESQAPMDWLLQSMKETPTSAYDRWKTPEAVVAGPAATNRP